MIEPHSELCACWASILLFAHIACNQVNNISCYNQNESLFYKFKQVIVLLNCLPGFKTFQISQLPLLHGKLSSSASSVNLKEIIYHVISITRRAYISTIIYTYFLSPHQRASCLDSVLLTLPTFDVIFILFPTS